MSHCWNSSTHYLSRQAHFLSHKNITSPPQGTYLLLGPTTLSTPSQIAPSYRELASSRRCKILWVFLTWIRVSQKVWQGFGKSQVKSYIPHMAISAQKEIINMDTLSVPFPITHLQFWDSKAMQPEAWECERDQNVMGGRKERRKKKVISA